VRWSLGLDGAEAELNQAKGPRRKGKVVLNATLKLEAQDREGSWRRASVHRRSTHMATRRSGHESHTHSWCTKIFVSHK
jgi:hypothetical protein